MRCFGDEELSNLREALDSQQLWRLNGTFVRRFEEAFAAWLGRKYVLAVCTGTAANETALAGLGLTPGDEVILPAAAPIFCSLPVVGLGCVPVFAECDPRTLVISPEGLAAAVTPRARAVVVVHLLGQPAPMEELLAVAARHQLAVVEDCAQAYGARDQGRCCGTMGAVACFSLQQSKHITSGEGGIIATDDPEIYRRAVEFSNSGMAWYEYGLERPAGRQVAGLTMRGHFRFGHDFRMGELAAAVALAQLPKLETFNAHRRELVAAIEDELRGAPGIELAYVRPGAEPNYWSYPAWVPEGLGSYGEVNYLDHVFEQMEAERRTSVGLPLPDYIHYRPGLCPITEAACRRWRGLNVHHSVEIDQAIASARRLRAEIAGALAAPTG